MATRTSQIVIKARDQASKTFGKVGRSSGGLIKRLFSLKAAIAGAFGGIAIGAAIKGLITAASEAEEVGSKFEAVFKDQTALAEQWGETFASQIGRSRVEIKGFLATMQDTFVPLGFARDQAREMSQTVTKLAVDLASFNNASDPAAIRDLQSALVGNHETMRKYGVIITQATLKTELLRMGIAGGVQAATEQQKAMARMNLIIAGTADAQGDAARTAGSFANQFKGLKAQVKDAAAEIGTALLPAATAIVSALREAMPTITAWGLRFAEMFAKVLESAGPIFEGLKSMFRTFWAVVQIWWEGIKGILSAFGLKLSGVGDAAAKIMEGMQRVLKLVVKVWVTGFTFVEVALTNWRASLELAMKAAALHMIGFGFTLKHWLTVVIPDLLMWFQRNWKQIFTDLFNATGAILTNMGKNIRDFFSAVSGWLAGEGFNFEWTGLLDGFESTLEEMPKIADRQLTEIEKKLGKRVGELSKQLGDEFKKKLAERLAKLEAAGAPGKAGGKADGKGKGPAGVPITVPTITPAAAVAAAGAGKAAGALESRFLTMQSRRDTTAKKNEQNTAEIVKLSRETAAASERTAVALEDLKANSASGGIPVLSFAKAS